MFGHIEEPWELAEHMRVIREVQERTGGITEFVPLSFIPFHTLLGRTHGIEEISREENLKHTAVFRLALGRSIVNLQASWVKMGLDAATEALSWGVNDLGGTLMEESISRLAGSYHGVRLDPPDLAAAAHRAGRPAAERSTLYAIRERYPVGVLPESPLDQVAVGDGALAEVGGMTSRRGDHRRRASRTLKAEIAELEGPVRAALAVKIKAAREEGDLSENAEYHALKEEQGHLETKILRLHRAAAQRRRRRGRPRTPTVVDVRQHGARHRPRVRPRADVHARRADRGRPEDREALVRVAGRARR